MLRVHPPTDVEREEEKKNLNFPKVYAQGQWTFHQPAFVLLVEHADSSPFEK